MLGLDLHVAGAEGDPDRPREWPNIGITNVEFQLSANKRVSDAVRRREEARICVQLTCVAFGLGCRKPWIRCRGAKYHRQPVVLVSTRRATPLCRLIRSH